SNNIKSFSEFGSALKEDGQNEVLYAELSEAALKMIKDNAFDLVITDEMIGDMSGLEFARKLISASPLTNCVAVSSLSEDDFHEASEGLGLMNHLPLNPGRNDAQEVLKNLKRIKGLESGQDYRNKG
ncbi:MAG: response regulator, partial [Deltaproteobacteria bacterium]|nr:response regulator [Deltaproteobacteria bacterium]